MFRIGPSCRPVVRQFLRTDFHVWQREFTQLTRCSTNETVSAVRGLSSPNCSKLRQILRREYRAICSMLQRSGLPDSNAALLRVLSSNFKREFHSSPVSSEKDNSNERGDKKNQDKNNDKSQLQFAVKVLTLLTALLAFASLFVSDNQIATRQVSWQEFVHQMLAKGEVQQIIVIPIANNGIANVVLHENAILNGKPVRNRVFTMEIPDIERFEEKLRETERQLGISAGNGVPLIFDRHRDSVWPSLAVTLLIGFLLLNMVAAFKVLKKGQMPWSGFTKAKFTLLDPKTKGEGRGVKFADIAGLQEAKQEVMEFVDYLKKPEHYRRLGAKVPKGSLLLGPPGCGKTLLAKAVATEADVPFLSMNGSEFVEVVGGLGASRVRDLFKEARKLAPCIVYIDEIDAIGGKRGPNSDFGGGEKIQTLLQLLIEMDGMANNEGVIMLASTNRADVLDEALLRPGRFDRHILIGQPTFQERKEIFEVYLNKLKLDQPASYYSGRLAQLTPAYSGADIANICNEAALHAAGLDLKKISASDLEYAVNRVKFGREKKQRTICDDERKQVAYYHAGRTIVGWMLKHTDALMKVSIIQYTSGIGSIQHFRPSSFLTFKEELCDRMTMYLGGKAAELIVFKQNSTQADKDLKKVSKVAYSMITDYGMNDVVGEVSFPSTEEPGNRFYSRKLHGVIDFEARKLINQSFSAAEEILKANAENLEKVAAELIKKETLSYDDICQLIGPPPHGHKTLVDVIEFGPGPNPPADTSSPRPADDSNNDKDDFSDSPKNTVPEK
ncbi:paraplegin isoform X1 [Frankliniella occidentalis]|uniref:Paraplegin isoform X1 n=1 Tax=Frankliniella occidentalis TaxID=133901 RepID=A0A6J1SAD2_FRAOC|nr:paraplegin isoform X1 [Frankliniella occidentalis]